MSSKKKKQGLANVIMILIAYVAYIIGLDTQHFSVYSDFIWSFLRPYMGVLFIYFPNFMYFSTYFPNFDKIFSQM